MIGSGNMEMHVGSRVELDHLVQAFNRGFSDYKYGAQFSTESMAGFLQRAGIELADCAVLVARETGDLTGLGMAMLAVDGDEAWCGGLAVAPEYRRQGAARHLVAAIQARAAARGAKRLWLEVLGGNESAQRLYESMGYRQVRELLIWERPSSQGALPIPFERLQEMDPRQILDGFFHWHDLRPSWQRRAGFLRRSADILLGYTVPAKDGQPVAYVLCREAEDEVTEQRMLFVYDVAVDPAADLLDAARPLLQALQVRYLDHDLRLINEPADSKLNRIFAALHFRVADRQHELVLDLPNASERHRDEQS